MTQAPPAQDLNIDEILKGFSTVEGATGYVVLNSDEGAPVKKSPGIDANKALHIAALIQDLWFVTKKVITNDLKTPDNSLEMIRMRTKHYYEYIITQAPNGEATLMATQNCVVAVPEKVVESKEVAKEVVQKQQ